MKGSIGNEGEPVKNRSRLPIQVFLPKTKTKSERGISKKLKSLTLERTSVNLIFLGTKNFYT
jgi:hypothetical protein